MTLPAKPRFTTYTKNDAVWATRVSQGKSIRQMHHLVNAKTLRATEKLLEVESNNGIKAAELENAKKAIDDDDPLEKVRMFLEK